ncbi:MAG TPA: DegT/DnrJ/EryC1/StrS family aminotransferase [Gammaproteobacteria bacterium]|nr:DegT/DnrJ/EryC1/StrS family aminotransferase [Gammaproteobacteria bacterium]
MTQRLESVPFLDLAKEYAGLEEAWLDVIRHTGGSGRFILGPEVTALEEEVASYVGAVAAVAVASGTDALELSLRSFGIGPGDEVITTPFTFYATAEVITRVGATPVFVDIDAHSFNLDLAQVAARITPQTRALLPVHLFGYPVDMKKLCALSDTHNLPVIEDAAQGFGCFSGTDKAGGHHVAAGYTGAFSFYPTKVLGCYGDGGMVTTQDEKIADQLRKLRNHGAYAPFQHDAVGCNSRLDEIQAALLRLKLRLVETAIAGRLRVAGWYDQMLADLDVVCPVRPQDKTSRHVFNLYTIRVKNRDLVRACLQRYSIGCNVCYPQPLHLQPVHRELGYQVGDLPVVEQACGEVLSLPIWPDMSEQQVSTVCSAIALAS